MSMPLPPSRFDLTPEDLEKPLPVLPTSASFEAELHQLSRDVCRLDPDLAEIAVSISLPTKTRDEKLAEIHAWGGA